MERKGGTKNEEAREEENEDEDEDENEEEAEEEDKCLPTSCFTEEKEVRLPRCAEGMPRFAGSCAVGIGTIQKFASLNFLFVLRPQRCF